MRAWILAARPKTLPAAIAPVLTASACAWADGLFAWVPAGIALLFALLLQIATNFANDYFDFRRGADTSERAGPVRATASGLVSPGAMKAATITTLLLAFAIGCTLLFFGGLWLLPIGIVFLVLAYAYTGGPYPLAYHGLGEVFVFVFFGPIATSFTYYVQAGEFALSALIAGLGLGAIATNLLQINNIRDELTDRTANKKTLVVRFGRDFGQRLLVLMTGVAMIVPILLVVRGYGLAILLPVLLFPLALMILRDGYFVTEPRDFNPVLARWAGFLLAYAFLLSFGFLFS